MHSIERQRSTNHLIYAVHGNYTARELARKRPKPKLNINWMDNKNTIRLTVDKQQILIQCTAHHLHINWTVLQGKFNERLFIYLSIYLAKSRAHRTNALSINILFNFRTILNWFYFSICQPLNTNSIIQRSPGQFTIGDSTMIPIPNNFSFELQFWCEINRLCALCSVYQKM